MELKQITLKNIRSYTHETVDFPLGSVLLSGDIGTGKSSILHAIDFALFGLRKGDLSGSSLLRNGEKNGFVAMSFRVDEKDVEITRTLKREKDSVVQDSGSITINSKRQDLSPLELKQKIIELLNYPKESLTKSKSLIYHYTVYTPQEEVKQILLGEKEVRLNTIRKIFGIDKYKRILENTKIFAGSIRERKKILEARIFDVDSKTKLHLELDSRAKEMETTLKELSQKVNSSYLLLEKKQMLVLELEEELKEHTKNLAELNLVSSKINSISLELDRTTKQLSLLKIEDMPLEQKDELGLKEKIKQNALKQEDLSKQIDEVNYKVTKLQIEHQNTDNIIKNIQNLDTCPVCLQKVDKAHKHKVIDPNTKKLHEITVSLTAVLQQKEELKQKQKELKQTHETLQENLKQIQIQNTKIKTNNTQKVQKQLLESNMSSLKQELQVLEQKLDMLTKKTPQKKDLEQTYKTEKQNLENLKKIQRDLELKYASQKSSHDSLLAQLENLRRELEELNKIKKSIEKIQGIHNFFSLDFPNIISEVEKNVMLRVHSDFCSLFERWFGVLVDPQSLQVRLDEEFSPIIEQNGYQIEYEYLSGGEKTSVALAYRLALNQVINNMLSAIKTKDLIILDEPTDGFSSEQLDRLRVLFDELNIKQTILVSHEPKIESFVQTVIRLTKKDHATIII